MTEVSDRLVGLSDAELAQLAVELRRKLGDRYERSPGEPIAIIGIGCRFPGGVEDPEGFWQLLRDGRDAVIPVPADRWAVEAYYDPDAEAPGKMCTRTGGFLSRVDGFDPQFFGIAPREVELLDPQHRLVLETAWEALERSGRAPGSLSGTRTGVFVGITSTDWRLRSCEEPWLSDPYRLSGFGLSFAAGRVSYLLGLNGPSLAIDTACSSSLVAIHLACQSLRAGESVLALAGGVNLILSPDGTVSTSHAGMMAPDGRCKTFDADADGMARGEGCGIVVLRRLSDALSDHDNILAVIRGTAVNQDGASSGLMVPYGPAQTALIRMALADAGLEPGDVDYVEAHGTGTTLGDPIEVQALASVFGAAGDRRRPLLLGSAKANIGHLESAAGIAGLIKVTLALGYGEVPPQPHFRDPSPRIPWTKLPVEVPRARLPWPAKEGARVAAVSAFGASGTNAHVVLESAPVRSRDEGGSDRPVHVLTLAAKTENGLTDLAARYAEHLAGGVDASFADICFTANTGRDQFAQRLAVVAASANDASRQLRAFAEGETESSCITGLVSRGRRPKVAFLFTGQGAQYVGMGRRLFEGQPTFRRALERCDAILRPYLDHSVLSVIYRESDAEASLDDTAFTQAAVFAVEYALAELWRSWGVTPSIVLGHSVGELAAACVAGVLSLEDGLRLIAQRGLLMRSQSPEGAMAAIYADERAVEAAVADRPSEVAVAAVNGPESVVISGSPPAVDEIIAAFEASGVQTRRLKVSRAFHSPLMEPILDSLEEVAGDIAYSAPRVGFVSNVTGALVDRDVVWPAYWRRHARQCVRFAEGVRTAFEQGCRVFVEIGPHPTLLTLAQDCVPDIPERTLWAPSLNRRNEDWQQILESAAALHVHGCDIDWAGVDRDYERRRVVLPTYPFQRRSYWIDVPSWTSQAQASGVADWMYNVEWRLVTVSDLAAVDGDAQSTGKWLILDDGRGVGAALSGALEAQGNECFLATPASTYERVGDARWTIEPTHPEHFARLLHEISDSGANRLRGVVHLWALEDGEYGDEDAMGLQRTICRPALNALQALASAGDGTQGRLWFVTRSAQCVDGEPVNVSQAPLWGLGRTIAIEHPDLWGGNIDLGSNSAPEEEAHRLSEIIRTVRNNDVALREGRCYTARLKRAAVTDSTGAAPREEGTYLISGGLGSLGLHVARHLVQKGARHLVLMSRRAPSAVAQATIHDLRRLQAEVVPLCGDVTGSEDVGRVLDQIRQTMPPLRGIIHAAGGLDRAPLTEKSWDRFASVLAPKVQGAWNLHQQTIHEEIELFMCFSSSAALLGLSGHGDYAAANAFLDGLAAYRRSKGLPGLSVNWGSWEGVGMAVTGGSADAARLAEFGMGQIPVAAGLEALDRVFGTAEAQVAVMPVRWDRFLRLFPTGSEPAFFESLVPEKTRERASAVRTPSTVRDASAPARQQSVESYLHELVATITRIPTSELDPNVPLQSVGLDSLMAVQLRNRLAADLGVNLRVSDIISAPGVTALVTEVTNQRAKTAKSGTVNERHPDDALARSGA